MTIGLVLATACGLSRFGWADDAFDRLDGPALAGVPEHPAATEHARLTLAEIGRLPVVLPGTRAGLVVVRTGEGNLARVLVSSALRRPSAQGGEPAPVVIVEQFDTFEADRALARVARGHDLLLFDGFWLDLDTGHVVPEGQGGDLQFRVEGETGPRLVAGDGASLFTLSESPLEEDDPLARPTPGRAVVPGDFAGRYRLFADGQWSGTLVLEVDESGQVSGRFRSDRNGSVYPVSGQVAAGAPHRVEFTVTYPAARHDFNGFLWTQGKGALAGVATLLDRPFGFFALRDGARVATAEQDEPQPADLARAGGKVVALQDDGRVLLDGAALDLDELTASLKSGADDPDTRVILSLSDPTDPAVVGRLLQAIRVAGIAEVRLAPTDPEPDRPE